MVSFKTILTAALAGSTVAMFSPQEVADSIKTITEKSKDLQSEMTADLAKTIIKNLQGRKAEIKEQPESLQDDQTMESSMAEDSEMSSTDSSSVMSSSSGPPSGISISSDDILFKGIFKSITQLLQGDDKSERGGITTTLPVKKRAQAFVA
ncbi:uncharacterized protein RCC_02112 [Ramularia collo-cygni]|uniref:Uncharacterized protein n=1 Tax=Ramularia collo-cygni TaxID=112498 RepID=A0A2D3UTT3_9PEZI|nr:uncharacterized protein RCC_02112 [Ramularia collo-cygni]CZT16270.1 uncharacterized protein RCC_02112 [Ramularia collo-cygni]